MRKAHTRGDGPRRRARSCMSVLPEGALMQRAAAGLAAAATAAAAAGLRLAGGRAGRRRRQRRRRAVRRRSRLAARGAAVTALTVSSRLHEAGAAAARRSGVVIREAGDPGDERVLAGGRSGARRDGRHRRQRRAADRRRPGWPHGRPRRGPIAVDVPSGVDADTGAVAGSGGTRRRPPSRSARFKPGLLMLPGRGLRRAASSWCRSGCRCPPADLEQLDAADVGRLLPDPGAESSKYTRGVLGITAGSDTYPGAAVLCTGGARRGGAGYLRFAGVAHAAELVRQHFPDVVATETAPGDGEARPRRRAGAGLGGRARTRARTTRAAAVVRGRARRGRARCSSTPMGSPSSPSIRNGCATGPHAARSTLLTPHEGEFARLVGGDPADVTAALAADRLGAVRRAAAELGVDRAAEGIDDARRRSDRPGPGERHRHRLAGRGRERRRALRRCRARCSLSGLSPRDAGSVGAWLHGVAAQLAVERHGPPLAALDLLDALPGAWDAARSLPQ